MKKILSATISLLLFALAGGEPAADVPLNSSGELQFGDARFRIAVFGSTWHENNNRQWRELNVTELPSGRELSAVLDVDDTPADIRGPSSSPAQNSPPPGSLHSRRQGRSGGLSAGS
ncbi:MAG: hypothetical protein L6W00_15755 [Lentisphaeria bacterium]|nr:MAG: hypothetical protein L6W00_15755 [Lentisphaeria bacterium]